MSELARKLIAENKRTRASHLDLSNCGLDEVPAEVADLHWLESITLAGFWFEWANSSWRTHASQNSGPSNANLADLTALTDLSKLTQLTLSGTAVTDLSPLANLSNLTTLYPHRSRWRM